MNRSDVLHLNKAKAMKEKSVAVSELAEVAVCPRRVYLRHKHGKRTTRQQQAHQRRGIEMHRQAEQQSRPDAPDKRCFIATAVYGQDARETDRLRRFRDERLMPHQVGRWCVATYYRISPALAALAARHKTLRRTCRWILDRIVEALR